MRRPNHAPAVPSRAVAVALAIALALLTGFTPIRPAAPVAAGTAETMEAQLVSLINTDRAARGLVPLRVHWKLDALAGDRAATLAAKGQLSHAAAGSLSSQLGARGIQYFGFGEAIGSTSYAWGSPAVTSLYNAWKSSSTHWALLMSRTYNYVGTGFAYRSANGQTYSSVILTESVDQTRPWAANTFKGASGSTISWKWRGADTLLQTHTSGLKNFDILYRKDGNGWTVLKWKTTATSLTLTGLEHDHAYSLRIRSRDHAGLVSNWTPEMWVWLP